MVINYTLFKYYYYMFYSTQLFSDCTVSCTSPIMAWGPGDSVVYFLFASIRGRRHYM